MDRYYVQTYEEKKEQSPNEVNTDNDYDVSSSTVVTKSTLMEETSHARLRRKQRCIDTKDLKIAMKYGTRAPHHFGKSSRNRRNQPTEFVRYTYKDIVYVVNTVLRKEVTCYALPIQLEPIYLQPELLLQHQTAVQQLEDDMNCWTSNTVIVIDTSGSMRTSDVWGTRNRLKSVLFSVALDYLAERLESGGATITDVVSIIAMGDVPQIVYEELPTTWYTYNKVVSLYSDNVLAPEGHGNYLPSLASAEELLKRNSNASCAAALVFLSDGAPSDGGMEERTKIVDKIESLSKAFGRRLTFTAIGIGDLDDFTMLQKMVDAATDYGATAELKLPSMTSSSLGQTFTSVATSLTTTQTEMTDIGSLKQRKVREVMRESKSKASEVLSEVSDDDFWFYGVDDVTRKIYKEYLDDKGMSQVYYDKVTLQHPDAEYVAFSKGPFGEGAERFAYRFYEIAADRKTILGSPMVAKESRMVLETADGMTENDARKQFVRKFIMTQQIARRLAKKFNDKLKSHPRVHQDTSQVSFLDCSIYELNDKSTGKSSVLVENKLDHNKWYKWNSNNGMVNGVRKSEGSFDSQHALLYKNIGLNEIVHNIATLDLNIIEEGSEEEDDDEDDDDDDDDEVKCGVEDKGRMITKFFFTPAQVAQAFSHYSYLCSNRKRLVCDLQGVYDEEKNMLQFSDPVIHYYNPHRSDRRGVHGRTDRGSNGINDFFKTHCCKDQGHLCQILTRGFKSVRRDRRSNPNTNAP